MLGSGRVSPETVRIGLRSIGSHRGRSKLVGFYLDGVGVCLGVCYGGWFRLMCGRIWSGLVEYGLAKVGAGQGWMLVSGGRSSPDWLGRICSRFGQDRVQTSRVGRAPSEYGWGSPEGGVSERLCLIECG